jgi:hypothetical protein
MFNVDRVFCLKNPKTGMTEWYFQAREGNVGPYNSKQQTEMMLEKFIQTCIKLGFTGGRGGEDKKGALSLQMQYFINYDLKADINWF